jgi:hypothetical protein
MSARKQSSESVGHIVAEEACSFGVRSGFQTFFQTFSKEFSQTFPNFLEQNSLEKCLGINGSDPTVSAAVAAAGMASKTEPAWMVAVVVECVLGFGFGLGV